VTSSADTPTPSRLSAALGGIVAGGVALGATELLAGVLQGAPSVVLEIGSLLISLQPAGAKQVVVDLFGTADKLVLNAVIVLGALAFAAGIGLLARWRPAWGSIGFAAIGIGGLAASLRDPLVDPILALAAAVLGILAATLTLGWLLRLARPSGAPEMPDWGRRRFIGTSLGVAALAATSGGLGRLLLNSRADAAPAPSSIPAAVDPVAPLAGGAELAVDGISPLIVPNRSFYRIDTNLLTPRIDAATWSLSVDGMVDHPFQITYQELLAMEMHEEYVTIACVSNEIGGDLVGNALWKGVRLRELLDRAGVQAGATQVVGHAFDGWTAGFPTAWLDDPNREALVAVAMNGDPLPPEHGFPARLIVPGLYGYVSATKWLARIGLTTLEAFDGYWVPLGWAKEAPILTQSRIDVPRQGTRVKAGRVPIAGVAWAPDRGISRVEVQVDDQPWAEAELSVPISDATWVQWLYRWDATTGNHVLSVRATDGTGQVQTAQVTRPAPDGARGHHTVGVVVEG
jgi:DMSO/TMAO reductase YedYZ molybdopterin-dependent catalytic subunit